MIDDRNPQIDGETPDLKRSRRKPRASAAAPTLDRLPPHSIEAEQGVLGCVLLSPNECLGECIEKLKQGPEAFYDLRHRTLYETLAEMYEEKSGIDLITVQQRLKDRQQLDGNTSDNRQRAQP